MGLACDIDRRRTYTKFHRAPAARAGDGESWECPEPIGWSGGLIPRTVGSPASANGDAAPLLHRPLEPISPEILLRRDAMQDSRNDQWDKVLASLDDDAVLTVTEHAILEALDRLYRGDLTISQQTELREWGRWLSPQPGAWRE